MSNPILELSEHELYFLPPGTSAIAPATRVEVEADGEVRTFLGRLEWQYQNRDDRDYYYIFHRPAQDESLGLIARGACIKARTVALTAEETFNWIRKNIKSCYPGYTKRLWHPPNADFGIDFAMYGFSGGHADIEWRRGERRPESVGFQWKLPHEVEDFDLWPQHDFLLFCQRLLNDENSEMNFALNWREKSEQEKDAIAFGCQMGDWKGLQHLFGCAQKLITCHLGKFPWPESERSQWNFDRVWSSRPGTVEPCAEAIAWSNRWRAAICEFARPSFWRDEPISIYRWRHHEPNRRKLLSVECTMPTHHELLEAQLELREFLRPHLSAAEIEALFVPDVILT